MKQGEKAKQFTSQHSWICVISKTKNWKKQFQKYKGRVGLLGDVVKDDSQLVCSVHRARVFCTTHDSCQSSGCQFQFAQTHRTRS